MAQINTLGNRSSTLLVDNTLTVTAGNVTAIGGNIYVGTTTPSDPYDIAINRTVAGIIGLSIQNESVAATGAVQVQLITEPGAGDVSTYFATNGGQEYTLGIDNSDSDKLKLTTGNSPSAGVEIFSFSNAGGIQIPTFNEGAMITDATGNVSSVTGTAGYVLTANTAGTAPSFQMAPNPTLFSFTAVNTTPYTVLSTDFFLGVDCSGGAITIKLPDAPATGRVFYVKDSTGNANTFNITVTTAGGIINIDGATSYVMNTQYSAIGLIFSGSDYEIF